MNCCFKSIWAINTDISCCNAQTEIISVRDLPAEDLIFGRYDSPNLEPTKALIAKADALIIVTPIYKTAYTGVLKAFLDLLPQKALSGKVILLLATAGTIAHLLSVDYALKPVLSELGARYILGSVYFAGLAEAQSSGGTRTSGRREFDQVRK
ncbi:MAG TPA: NAD(P)H-dependent oxidoreductase [Coleofasciculaceae cyanobacterium]